MHNLPHNFQGRLHANGLHVIMCMNYMRLCCRSVVNVSVDSDMSDMYNYAHAIMLLDNYVSFGLGVEWHCRWNDTYVCACET